MKNLFTLSAATMRASKPLLWLGVALISAMLAACEFDSDGNVVIQQNVDLISASPQPAELLSQTDR